MELRHLRYFVAVAEERHFGRAAERLHVTQSTLSTQIQGLEREVGGPLFVRTSRRVELTEAGDLLLAEARRTLAQADRALGVARQSISGEAGTVRIGFAGVVVLQGDLVGDLRRFRAERPRVEISLVELPPAAQAEAVRDGTIDVGYSPDLGLTDTAGVVLTRRAPLPLSIAVRADHALAALDAVTAGDLAGHDLIGFAAGENDETVLPRLWPDGPPGRVHLAGSTLGVLALAASGGGIAVVPAATARIAVPGIVYLPLVTTPGGAGVPVDGPDVVVISRIAETSGAVRAFLCLPSQR